jgi:putative flavoprotein involved in K+ transport
MQQLNDTKVVETIVIGAGQAGLAVGYHLSQRGLPFVMLDANERVGDQWRRRWDSLRLFTPAKFDSLPGMPFPAPPNAFPTKDAMGDYLEAYARQFDLPVETGVRVERLSRNGSHYIVEAGDQRYEARNVVVAMANYQRPWVPEFANQLRSDIVQLHSADYRNPTQTQPGDVLLVGAGNSGSEIALELSRTHRVWMSGRDTGYIPFRVEGLAGRLILVRLVLRVLFHRILTIKTPLGRKARPKIIVKGGPLIRVKRKDLEVARVTRVPRIAGIEDGRPVLDDGRVMDVSNVIWCTGFRPGFSWIDLPIHGDREPQHRSGTVEEHPGLYFVGLHFLSALSSAMIHGVGRDAQRIAKLIASRSRRSRSSSRVEEFTAA